MANKKENTSNILAIAEEIEQELNNSAVEIEQEIDSAETAKLWAGLKKVRLTSIEKNEDGTYRLYFMDSNNQPMPSQFEGQDGALYMRNIQALKKFTRNMQAAFHMPSTATTKDILSKLEEYNNIYFVVKSSMKSWGLSMYNVIDYAQTMNKQ